MTVLFLFTYKSKIGSRPACNLNFPIQYSKKNCLTTRIHFWKGRSGFSTEPETSDVYISVYCVHSIRLAGPPLGAITVGAFRHCQRGFLRWSSRPLPLTRVPLRIGSLIRRVCNTKQFVISAFRCLQRRPGFSREKLSMAMGLSILTAPFGTWAGCRRSCIGIASFIIG